MDDATQPTPVDPAVEEQTTGAPVPSTDAPATEAAPVEAPAPAEGAEEQAPEAAPEAPAEGEEAPAAPAEGEVQV